MPQYPKPGGGGGVVVETDPVAAPAVTAEQARAQAAEAAKQDAATAATDAELASEASRAQTAEQANAAAIAGKQDAATAATDAEVAAKTAHIVTDELLVAKSLNSPMQRPILSGQFTPQGDKVTARFDIAHAILEPDGCWLPWFLFYGPTNVGMLTPKHQADALAPGVTRVLLGTSSDAQANVTPEVLLTGLVPGQTYAYELTHGLVGGAGMFKSAAPSYIASSDTASPWPDGAIIIAVKDANVPPNLRIYKGQHTIGKFTDALIGGPFAQPAAATNAFGKIDVTPDGTRVVVCNQQDGAVQIYTTGLLTGAAPALQARVPFPAASTTVIDVVCMPDNTTAWVIGGGQYVYKLDLVAGTFGINVALGAATGVQTVAASPDGAYVYVACSTSGLVKKIRTSDAAVVATSPVIAGAKAVAVSVDGAAVFVGTTGRNPNQLAKLNAADLTIAAQVNVNGNTPNVEDIEAFPDGRCILLACSNTGGAGGASIKQYETADLSNYTNWANGLSGNPNRDAFDLAITQNGTMYIPDQTDGVLNVWFGGSLVFTPSSNFWGHVIRARFRGAS